MTKDDYMEWLFAVVFSIIGVCVAAVLFKLTYDFYTAPNIFIKKEPVVEQSQKQIDEMCVAWWFESDLGSAKKRVCGK
jgi:hypothetical protein